jgi:endoribonuclease LACTB2
MVRPRELSLSVELFSVRTPTLAPATHTNSYALGGRDVVLVEPSTPYAAEQRAWVEWARALESKGRKLVAIFATHHHVDHVGGLDELARELNVPVWAHSWTADHLGRDKFQRTLEDGETFVLEGPFAELWTALHTPGHAPGHLCLWNATSRTLVVGDMVASIGTILIAPGDGDMAEYVRQLERLAILDARLALPAHGNPIDEPSRLFRHYVIHRRMRENKVLSAVDQCGLDGATAEDLVPIAYADTATHIWPLALLSLRAHLDKLVRDGRVVQRADHFVSASKSVA